MRQGVTGQELLSLGLAEAVYSVPEVGCHPMEVSPSLATVIRFGVFELDPRAGELRKNGLRVRLPDQSLQVLAILLKSPGDVVTREELRRELWPGGTFVDFDHGLNAAVSRLRVALHDSAEDPRFIETMARHGYRFIAPVNAGAGPRARPPDGAHRGGAPTKTLGPRGIHRRGGDNAGCAHGPQRRRPARPAVAAGRGDS